MIAVIRKLTRTQNTHYITITKKYFTEPWRKKLLLTIIPLETWRTKPEPIYLLKKPSGTIHNSYKITINKPIVDTYSLHNKEIWIRITEKTTPPPPPPPKPYLEITVPLQRNNGSLFFTISSTTLEKLYYASNTEKNKELEITLVDYNKTFTKKPSLSRRTTAKTIMYKITIPHKIVEEIGNISKKTRVRIQVKTDDTTSTQ